MAPFGFLASKDWVVQAELVLFGQRLSRHPSFLIEKISCIFIGFPQTTPNGTIDHIIGTLTGILRLQNTIQGINVQLRRSLLSYTTQNE